MSRSTMAARARRTWAVVRANSRPPLRPRALAAGRARRGGLRAQAQLLRRGSLFDPARRATVLEARGLDLIDAAQAAKRRTTIRPMRGTVSS